MRGEAVCRVIGEVVCHSTISKHMDLNRYVLTLTSSACRSRQVVPTGMAAREIDEDVGQA